MKIIFWICEGGWGKQWENVQKRDWFQDNFERSLNSFSTCRTAKQLKLLLIDKSFIVYWGKISLMKLGKMFIMTMMNKIFIGKFQKQWPEKSVKRENWKTNSIRFGNIAYSISTDKPLNITHKFRHDFQYKTNWVFVVFSIYSVKPYGIQFCQSHFLLIASGFLFYEREIRRWYHRVLFHESFR